MDKSNGGRPLNRPQSDLHVGIIMDGSGRWGQARGLSRVEGHRAGRAAVRRAIGAAVNAGIRVLTLFTFSTDNWGRPENEVAELMRIFEDFFRMDAPAIAAQGVRVTVIGRRDRLPPSLRDAIDKIDVATGPSEQLLVRLAIDYSGREAILHAARQFRHASDDSVERFARLLAENRSDAGPVADVDLLIRTGGEQRLSNCPLWEIAYAELYFTPCLWPDFDSAEFDAALQEFRSRDRRFGRIPAVIS